MTEEDLHRLAQEGLPALVELGRKLEESMRAFNRSMAVAALFNGHQGGPTPLKDVANGITDEEFLRDLEHFGGALASAARAQRTKNEVRRTGSCYGPSA